MFAGRFLRGDPPLQKNNGVNSQKSICFRIRSCFEIENYKKYKTTHLLST